MNSRSRLQSLKRMPIPIKKQGIKLHDIEGFKIEAYETMWSECNLKSNYQKHDVPEEYLGKWQKTVDLMAKIFDVQAGLIMRVMPSQIEVLVSSQTQGNPYKPHEISNLDMGLYCETVMSTGSMLQVPNALQDEQWKDNPDVAINMISYLGIPLVWRDRQIFGTICILDDRIREFSKLYQDLLYLFKKNIESDFQIIQKNEKLMIELTSRKQAEDKTRKLNEELEELNRVFVGRELKMIELKKRIAELERDDQGKVKS